MNAVIFDMDGVMFDTEKVCMLAWDYAGKIMGVGKAGYMGYAHAGDEITGGRQGFDK